MKDKFDKTHVTNKGNGYFQFSPKQFEEIVNKGFIFIQPYPGIFKKITIDNILFDKEEVDKILKEKLSEKK